VHYIEILYILSEIEYWSFTLLCSWFHLFLVESWVTYAMLCYFGDVLTLRLLMSYIYIWSS